MSLSGNKISILGCGWLGLPLAKQLVHLGFKVKGSTTQKEKLGLLSDAGIQPFQIKLPNQTELLDEFLSSEILLINIPPGTKRNPDNDAHLKDLSCIIPHIRNSPIQKVIYISSTSIYHDLNRPVVEEDIDLIESASSKIIFLAEESIRDIGKDYVILRLGGLTGYDRFLLKYFSGKKGVSGGNAPVNLLHLDDAVNGIIQVIKSRESNDTFNFCSPKHPGRKEFYQHLSDKYKYPAPDFSSENSNFKIVEVEKFIRTFNYSFLYPDPFYFSYTI